MNRNTGSETIAAVATPPGLGGIGIVRVSGPGVPDVARALLGQLPVARHASFTRFRAADGVVLDEGLALYFPAPHSYTGEHVLELQGHGGPVVLNQVMQAVLAAGARPARAGEFSERAFLNGKLDLTQAEAVADLIESASAEAARAALNSLQGAFAQRIGVISEALIAQRLRLEASIDFPEDETDFRLDQHLSEGLSSLAEQFETLLAAAHQGQLLHDGMTVVLAGPPNAGKSSLLNALAQRDAAIVSAQPGTTRDVLREQIQIDGMPLHVLDTAGLRDTTDVIESEGVRRAHTAMQQADRVLLVVDDTDIDNSQMESLLRHLPESLRVTVVRNKIDRSGRAAGVVESGSGRVELAVSALHGAGLEDLRQHLKQCMGYRVAGEGSFSARRRHRVALERAQAHLQAATVQLRARQVELAAEELRLSHRALGEITGEFSSDELLGRIFASFCIGK